MFASPATDRPDAGETDLRPSQSPEDIRGMLEQVRNEPEPVSAALPAPPDQAADCLSQIAEQLSRLDTVLTGFEPELPGSVPKSPLSPRESEIPGWIAQGKSNAVIAQILGISRHTVDTHIRRIFGKLGTTDRTTAAIRAISAGLL